MFRPVKKPLSVAIVIVCLLVPSFGYAAIGTEPSNQAPETINPLSGPLPSVPSAPGFLPGVQDEGTTPYPPMNFSSSLEASGTSYPQYRAVMPQNPEGMPGMMMMPPYPSYAEGNEMYPSTYQDPSQNPWNPSMPGMGYTGMNAPYASGMEYLGMNAPYASGMGYPGMNAPYISGTGRPGVSAGYPPYAQQYASVDEMYNRAREAYTSGDYRSAMSMFYQVATWYPQSDLADNAHYWMGEIYYSGKNYPAAIQSFQTVMYSYPSGNKLPDAMVKMGYAYAEMRQYGIARSILNDVASRFSDNARIRNLAVKKLNELGNY